MEIVTEFPGRNKNSIKELMRLRIPCLCFMKDLADVVDRLLYGLDSASRTGSFSLDWGLARPQVSRCFAGSGPGLTLRSRAGCFAGGGRTSFSYRGIHKGPPREMLGPLCDQHHADHFGRRCKVKKQCLTWSGATRTGKEVRYCLISWRARSASSAHVNGPDLLISLKKGRALSASLEMKRLRAAKTPSTSARP
jgi:hypothetical protein